MDGVTNIGFVRFLSDVRQILNFRHTDKEWRTYPCRVIKGFIDLRLGFHVDGSNRIARHVRLSKRRMKCGNLLGCTI